MTYAIYDHRTQTVLCVTLTPKVKTADVEPLVAEEPRKVESAYAEPLGAGGRALHLVLAVILFVAPVACFIGVFFVPDLGRKGGTMIEMFVEMTGPAARIVIALILLAMTREFWKGAMGVLGRVFQPNAPSLHRLAEMGDRAAINELLAAGVDKDARDPFGNTALHIAAFKGHAALVAELLAAGFDKDAKDKRGERPLHKAAAKDHVAIVSTLIAAGANVDATDAQGGTALHQAANDSGVETIPLLLAAGANADTVIPEYGFTPLHLAVIGGQVKGIRLLLAAGANKGMRDKLGRTAMDIAKSMERSAAVNTLAENAQ